MRSELADWGGSIIRPMLLDNRSVSLELMTGTFSTIFWVLRSGAPWRDLPESYGPYAATCYKCFVR
jgi:transposase